MMIGKVSAAALIAFIGMSGAAYAEGGVQPGGYISFGGGYNAIDDINSNNINVEFDDGYNIFAAVGYDFGDRAELGKLRVEGELSWSDNDLDSASSGGVTASLGGGAEQFGLMGNAYWDFLPGSQFRPYLGIGMGLVDTDVEASVGGLSANDSETAFAYRGTVGAAFHIDANWAIDIGYRYTVVTHDEDLENQSVVGALRYKF